MTDSLGIGIVGAGFIGRVHANAARLAGARLVGVVASDPARSIQAAAELGAEERFGDALELIDHPDVDVVHVCTPNYLHHELVRRVLDKGKHVVCEKPLATSSRAAEDLVRVAADAGVVAAVPLCYRYHAMVHEARARVLGGEIGSVHLVHGSYLQDWCLPAENGNWRVSADLGGLSRAFADIGTHWCDLFEWITGQRIVELCSVAETVIPKRPASSGHTFGASADAAVADDWQPVDTEDVACMIFRATGDVIGTLTVSQVAAGRKNRIWLEIDGRDGSVVFDEERADRLWLGRSAGNLELIRDPNELSSEAGRVSSLPAGHIEGFLDIFTAFLTDVYQAVNGAEHHYPSFEDGARSSRITEAVLRSSTERRWIGVVP